VRDVSSHIGIVSANHSEAVVDYLSQEQVAPLLLLGDAYTILRELPSSCVDCVMTSPPYWQKREYEHCGLGNEEDFSDYVRRLAAICLEIKRVLKPTGSLWLNLGDSYRNKSLLGIPWRIAIELTDKQGWVLRNAIVWYKIKGGLDSATDRLGNSYEMVFHFVKRRKGYYYNLDSVRSKPREAKVINGMPVSATGVRGIRYRQQILSSTTLSEQEKIAACESLDKMLEEMANGRIADFRMIIRGHQRATHSDSEKVSGRAKELREKGFYFLRYHPRGSKPTDVWAILPEDTHGRSLHFAPYPVELCRIPILTTCPPDGVVLDPFCGTGTTLYAALSFRRKSIGIDISHTYLNIARERCSRLL